LEDRISGLDEHRPVLCQELRRATESREPVAAVERILLRSLGRADERQCVSAALDGIARSRGQVEIRALAADAGVSKRYLERMFQERVGIGPKAFARIVRFQRVLNTTGANWAAVAAEAGYFDQAHLARDFKAFTGESPAAWARRRETLPQGAFLQDGPGGSL
jgi:AraC-like DNA-binding protein